MVRRKFNHKSVFATLTAVVLAGVIAFNWHQHSKPKLKPVITTVKAPASNSAIPAANMPDSQKAISAPNGTSTTASNGSSATSSNGSSVTLFPPYGTFVSNHHPSLGDSAQELSTCSTTPGASCYIKFTKYGLSTQLPTQTTDGSGSTSWLWSVKGAGLSEGSWSVTAVTTYNGQTKTTADGASLEVRP